MDVMGDKATLLETGRFVQPADFVQSAGELVQPEHDASRPTDGASQPVAELVRPEADFAVDRPADQDETGRPPRRLGSCSQRRPVTSRR